ncbi:exodeoxyribonuclease VII large subunit [Pricia sp. S334]|uniref:Exodeoxyribonuclease 7 large subunit n=1 Tax=Pricia mediterranea TaxID=3076079 RepID=A0ABU3L7Z8_9FLAO|nr:exodeoxyribonuclease VII large subunit [Pricia sp. S334]MDT7829683.1 exodeoxyribonuclease VII large subunit [Pricia sp. S334]
MPEEISGKRIFSLLEVTKSIQKTIGNRYQSAFWVKAEMNKLNHYQRSGHCYPEMVEKKGGKIIAEMRAILWKSDFQRTNANFRQVLKEPLKDGIKILFLASLQFDPKYGLTLHIHDIDPSFTLGDLQKEKQDTIKKLQVEGIFAKNKQIELSVLPQRIAVISVETSKGYADFINVFESAAKTWNYTFFHLLFPSLLQGDKAVKTIIAQLKNIEKVVHHFDVVAIVRGGGGDIGLSCYNHYDLAREIAEFPIPVFTGIGHSTNETVAELIAHENAITPTKLAEFLIQKFHDFSVPVQTAESKIGEQSQRLIRDAKTQFVSEVKLLRSVCRNVLHQKKNVVVQEAQSLSQFSRFLLGNQKFQLNAAAAATKTGTYQCCSTGKQQVARFGTALEKNVQRRLERTRATLENTERNLSILNPKNVLKRGYSITRLNGKSIRVTQQLKQGDVLDTTLYQGSVSSTVKTIDKK